MRAKQFDALFVERCLQHPLRPPRPDTSQLVAWSGCSWPSSACPPQSERQHGKVFVRSLSGYLFHCVTVNRLPWTTCHTCTPRTTAHRTAGRSHGPVCATKSDGGGESTRELAVALTGRYCMRKAAKSRSVTLFDFPRSSHSASQGERVYMICKHAMRECSLSQLTDVWNDGSAERDPGVPAALPCSGVTCRATLITGCLPNIIQRQAHLIPRGNSSGKWSGSLTGWRSSM
jgi:hypothetical protein